jgi:hypothetical protein
MKDNVNIHDCYEGRPASKQNALDIFHSQWVSAVPGYKNEGPGLFADPRVAWAIDQVGTLRNKHVLELGPLEGGHTFMLHEAGASHITCVEANSRCYLKCLVTKEVFSLNRAELLFGDFAAYLTKERRRFDYIHAAGVLYHLVSPLEFLHVLCESCPQLYLWTHYVDRKAMPEDDPRYIAGIVGMERASCRGITYNVYRRKYHGDPSSETTFCGGIYSNPLWIERDSILSIIKQHGFVVSVAHDMPDHPNGPCFSVFASKG